ncbi:hypothetical protein L1C76_00040 [Klebsiella pneumoniae]|uniref:hypothetical protein n=1 Tax=Klebsiella pneumoniae TaxID=573 RepID=UPI0020CF44B5|nr:hypothetical protein [Klebsiella pneumoniae]MCQ0735025.1 hypothetical protein [Klebsiella pneumoniae]MEB5562833.1 hypothetical protein [Klebsiella pneumoniae]
MQIKFSVALLALALSAPCFAGTVSCTNGAHPPTKETISISPGKGNWLDIRFKNDTLSLPLVSATSQFALFHGQAQDGSGGMFELTPTGAKGDLYFANYHQHVNCDAHAMKR